MYVDPDGDFPILAIAIISIVLTISLKADNPYTAISQDLAAGRIFRTYEEATNTWGSKNGLLTGKDGLERGAFVYTVRRADGNTYYTLSKTYKGSNDHVVGGFIKGYFWSIIRSKLGYDLVGFIHTHPHEHKSRDNTSNADDFLMYLKGISRGSIYDINGVGIQYDRFGSYDPYGNYYPSGSSTVSEAFWLMIMNGHG